MGMVNCGQTFSRLMSMVLKRYEMEKFSNMYFNNIRVFRKDFDSKLENLRENFNRLHAANMKFKGMLTFFLEKNKNGECTLNHNILPWKGELCSIRVI